MVHIEGKIIFAATSVGNNVELDLGLNQAMLIEKIIKSDIVAVENLMFFDLLCKNLNIKTTAEVKLFDYAAENNNVNEFLVESAKLGKTILIVSDGGTAGLYDPGDRLIQLALKNSIKVEVMPGPTSIIPAILMSGFFLGKGFVSLGWIYKFLPENNILPPLDNWFKDLFLNSPVPIALLYTSNSEELQPPGEGEKLKATLRFLKDNLNKDKNIYFINNMYRNTQYEFRGTLEGFCVELEKFPPNFSNGILVIEGN